MVNISFICTTMGLFGSEEPVNVRVALDDNVTLSKTTSSEIVVGVDNVPEYCRSVSVLPSAAYAAEGKTEVTTNMRKTTVAVILVIVFCFKVFILITSPPYYRKYTFLKLYCCRWRLSPESYPHLRSESTDIPQKQLSDPK